MTRIPPFPLSPATALRSPPIPASDPLSAGQTSFASLLTEDPAMRGGDLLDPASASDESITLREAVAEVFNAHGFFASDPTKVEAKRVSENQVGLASFNLQPLVQGAANIEAGGENALIEPDPAGESNFDLQSTVSPGGDGVARQRLSASFGGRTAARPIGASIPMSAKPLLAEEPAEPIEQSKVAPRLPRADGASTTADRLIFQFGRHAVELTGKMKGLSRDEQDQLLAQLSAVLESHGLSLGHATLNGRLLTSAILRSHH